MREAGVGTPAGAVPAGLGAGCTAGLGFTTGCMTGLGAGCVAGLGCGLLIGESGVPILTGLVLWATAKVAEPISNAEKSSACQVFFFAVLGRRRNRSGFIESPRRRTYG